MSRLSELDGALIDVVIIGGGIAGSGIARDLAHRGVPVVLFERRDFGSGTTSRSSKLIHGGLRYLEQLDLGLVRESLREREILRRLAPHLIHPTPFLLPIYRDSTRSLFRVRLGLALYRWFTPPPRRARHRVLRPVDALAVEPGIRAEELRGAGYYVDDIVVSPERLCLENVLSAVRRGARAGNYCDVEGIRWGRTGVEAVRVRDLLTDRVATVRARMIVNAAGPWVDPIREQAGIAERGLRITRTTKGIHVVLPRLSERAIYHSTGDGRMILVVPWRDLSLVGTTDTDFDDDPDHAQATAGEVAYLLDAIRGVFPSPRATADEVLYTYAGVRPLALDGRNQPSAASRAHQVVTECAGTLVSVTGAKLTTFRSLAAQVGDVVIRTLGRTGECQTARLALDGADTEMPGGAATDWMEVSDQAAEANGLSTDTLQTLVATYGRAYARVVDLARVIPDGADRLCSSNPEVVAQLHYSVHHEMAVSLQDVLLRRTGIGTSRCQGRDCAESIGQRLAPLLRWSPRRLSAELAAWEAHGQRSRGFRSEAPSTASSDPTMNAKRD